MSEALVAIVVGSEKDWSVMNRCSEMLESLGISYEKHTSSAHRNPERTAELAKGFAGRGIKVVIAGAGMAAHLPGVIAAHTYLPVIGVPIASGLPGGIDSLLSIVQMPSGIPVATVAVGEAGAKNSAILAAEILSISDERISSALYNFRDGLKKS